MTTSVMHRRPFEGRHLVLSLNSSIVCAVDFFLLQEVAAGFDLPFCDFICSCVTQGWKKTRVKKKTAGFYCFFRFYCFF